MFVKLINLSLASGIFPDEWKCAKITIIPKKGDLKSMDNLRPISILSELGKICEKFVKKQLVDYFEGNGIFYDWQFGFRSNRSVNDAVFLLVDEIFNAKNSGLNVCTAFLNLTKAFNYVDHKIIIKKLKHYGINEICLKWFTSYFENRTQYTVIGNSSSLKDTVTCGVQQGSVLGPILYLIYVNDINYCKINSKILMFADDLVLISIDEDPTVATNNLKRDLDAVMNYFLDLNLLLNPKKSKIMNFNKYWHRANRDVFPDIKINGTAIEKVDSFKYLGVTIDLGLRFNLHKNNCIGILLLNFICWVRLEILFRVILP